MTKKLKPEEDPASSRHSAAGGWDENCVVARTPSGKKILIGEDEEMLGRFLGVVDISEQCDKPPDSAVYLSFFDGRRIVNISRSHALVEVKWVRDHYYYIHNEGSIEMTKQPTPMRDYFVVSLGVAGNVMKVPARIDESLSWDASDAAIATLNYSRLNYPLRP